MSANDFNTGPFSFERMESARLNGTPSDRWRLSYGSRHLAEHWAPATAQRPDIRELFIDDIAGFKRRHRADNSAPAQAEPAARLQLIDHATGDVLDECPWAAEIPGFSAGLTDDRWPTWLIKPGRPQYSMPMTADEFARLASAMRAADAARRKLAAASGNKAAQHPNAWIAELLPAEVLSDDVETWRAPSAWEVRHIVGEGSFTGITGARAAALIGVSDQHFRKYLAADGAASRLSMPFAAWHLLLQRTGVQRLEVQ